MGDARVRPEHANMDGIVRPVNDPFWNAHYPPNGWHCRCGVTQLNSGEETDLETRQIPVIPEAFRTNLAKQGMALPEKGGYFDKADKKVVDKTAEKLERDHVRNWANINLKGGSPLMEVKLFSAARFVKAQLFLIHRFLPIEIRLSKPVRVVRR